MVQLIIKSRSTDGLKMARKALQFLTENEFIEPSMCNDDVTYKLTKLGEATVVSSLSPLEGNIV